MQTDAYILNLAARKLAGEASNDELDELNKLLSENQTLSTSLKNIFATWDTINFESNLSEKEIEQSLSLVLNRIHNKIKTSGNITDEPLKNCD